MLAPSAGAVVANPGALDVALNLTVSTPTFTLAGMRTTGSAPATLGKNGLIKIPKSSLNFDPVVVNVDLPQPPPADPNAPVDRPRPRPRPCAPFAMSDFSGGLDPNTGAAFIVGDIQEVWTQPGTMTSCVVGPFHVAARTNAPGAQGYQSKTGTGFDGRSRIHRRRGAGQRAGLRRPRRFGQRRARVAGHHDHHHDEPARAHDHHDDPGQREAADSRRSSCRSRSCPRRRPVRCAGEAPAPPAPSTRRTTAPPGPRTAARRRDPTPPRRPATRCHPHHRTARRTATVERLADHEPDAAPDRKRTGRRSGTRLSRRPHSRSKAAARRHTSATGKGQREARRSRSSTRGRCRRGAAAQLHERRVHQAPAVRARHRPRPPRPPRPARLQHARAVARHHRAVRVLRVVAPAPHAPDRGNQQIDAHPFGGDSRRALGRARRHCAAACPTTATTSGSGRRRITCRAVRSSRTNRTSSSSPTCSRATSPASRATFRTRTGLMQRVEVQPRHLHRFGHRARLLAVPRAPRRADPLHRQRDADRRRLRNREGAEAPPPHAHVHAVAAPRRRHPPLRRRGVRRVHRRDARRHAADREGRRHARHDDHTVPQPARRAHPDPRTGRRARTARRARRSKCCGRPARRRSTGYRSTRSR